MRARCFMRSTLMIQLRICLQGPTTPAKEASPLPNAHRYGTGSAHSPCCTLAIVLPSTSFPTSSAGCNTGRGLCQLPAIPFGLISRDGQRAGPFSSRRIRQFCKRLAICVRQIKSGKQACKSWIAYGYYDARKAADRLVNRYSPGASAKTDDETETCAICHDAKGLARIGQGVGRSFSQRLNALGKATGVTRFTRRGCHPGTHPERAPREAARPSADPHPASIRPSLFGAKELKCAAAFHRADS